eukprot:2861018-Amphidinium_carterae.1
MVNQAQDLPPLLHRRVWERASGGHMVEKGKDLATLTVVNVTKSLRTKQHSEAEINSKPARVFIPHTNPASNRKKGKKSVAEVRADAASSAGA